MYITIFYSLSNHRLLSGFGWYHIACSAATAVTYFMFPLLTYTNQLYYWSLFLDLGKFFS